MGLPFYLVPFLFCSLVLLEPIGALQIMPPRKRPSGAPPTQPMKAATAMKTMKAAVPPRRGSSISDARASMKRTNSSSAPTVPKARAGKPAGSVRSKRRGVMKSDTEADCDASDSDSKSLNKSKAKKKLAKKARAELDSAVTDTEADPDSDSVAEEPVETAPKDGRFLDVTAYKTGLPFDATAAKILPGSALVVRHLLMTGAKDVDALYYVHDCRHQVDGVLCECTFVGASGKAHSDFQNIRKGTDHVLHLCSSTNGCPSLRNRSSVVHALVWKPLAFSKLTDPWITASMIDRFKEL